MEQEPPENVIPADEEPTGVRQSAAAESVPSAPAADRLDAPATEYGIPEPISEDLWRDDPAESTLEVVDPYTAAPPASAFPETAAPFGRSESEPGEIWRDQQPLDDLFVPIPYLPSTQNETIRRTGLAWSAGIAFFGSVAFTLFLGWLADLLLGTSPWGIVGGIVLGSVIGFLQFFRITSQIFARKDDGPEISPLMSRKDDE